ncbi:TPA: MarR family transcriptional regulator [Vibrio parahaemolyticus]|uniref:MarR family transcriptional regulator n=1 Tax=Vibrio parahaemolyticus TaxID=670 RepID=UPI001120F9B9|nr:MarR family transcriptional regulator [Vibrio parahaemolyticus]EHK7404542.1 MarR family transcriptional regulator [Vibrio parahaemolyticus]TOL75632.1 MarR family transcriptional regulator [Vibrio parahaemolyticus]HCE4578016.1 MarR family transcriptional regulator [Vibrio parahaemolyticus]HCG7585822.1 MarR family transcriptional regulator [Vibrio parahaemolyticus]HCG9645041.1 MarR family transcriptional regulator [Vibrio parahaemolyticus]
MRLAHKRKVQMKLQKRIKATVANLAAAPKTAKPVAEKAAVKPVVEKAVAEKKVAAAQTVDVALTPKQQQVLDIVVANAEGINPKGIGLAAGQEDAKAASWATGALKKLLEENLVQKEQLAGNKVIYKAV